MNIGLMWYLVKVDGLILGLSIQKYSLVNIYEFLFFTPLALKSHTPLSSSSTFCFLDKKLTHLLFYIFISPKKKKV